MGARRVFFRLALLVYSIVPPAPVQAQSAQYDPARVALVGHSMGGWAALMTAGSDSSVACTVALDYVNLGAVASRLKTGPKADSLYSAEVAAYQRKTRPGGPYRAESGKAIVDQFMNDPYRYDVDRFAPVFRSRPILMISAVFPEFQQALAGQIANVSNNRMTALAWRTDHSFSDRRIELSRTVSSWLKSQCGF